ncbi:Trp repressor family protein [Listeria cornellensis FSL F6-0969]|uniref:Trp repressor family protein n=1 Tax=Listeria cornellensis FSL F6-0969 TaxID=1265820 RepID=W7C3M8_9LIST|nr:Trp repressor family protein [Listeria cornellensis FSL F6-0969]
MALENLEECYAFFDDVCTVNEIQSMSQRFQVARMLHDGKTYNVIEAETGASTATISRVKRSLNYGNDMYEVVFDRMKDK